MLRSLGESEDERTRDSELSLTGNRGTFHATSRTVHVFKTFLARDWLFPR